MSSRLANYSPPSSSHLPVQVEWILDNTQTFIGLSSHPYQILMVCCFFVMRLLRLLRLSSRIFLHFRLIQKSHYYPEISLVSLISLISSFFCFSPVGLSPFLSDWRCVKSQQWIFFSQKLPKIIQKLSFSRQLKTITNNFQRSIFFSQKLPKIIQKLSFQSTIKDNYQQFSKVNFFQSKITKNYPKTFFLVDN